MTALLDLPEQEDEKEREILEKAKPKIVFFQDLGRAITKPDITSIDSTWLGPDCHLAFSITEGEFRANGEYKRQVSGLAAASLPGSPRVIHYKIEYIGRVIGRRIEGTVRRIDPTNSSSSSLLGRKDDEVSFAMILADHGNEISAVENLMSSFPRFYLIKKA